MPEDYIPLYLQRILDKKQIEIRHLYESYGIAFLKEKIERSVLPHYSLKAALSKPGLNLIAEVKRASPSKGIIRKEFDPLELAKSFQKMGASVISVLTERFFFLGDPVYIPLIKSSVFLPILRKDFITDPIQLYEAKAIGADAVLLIKAILDISTCQHLIEVARSLDLDILFEIHSEAELIEIQTLTGLDFIGINNRNLNTFETHIHQALQLYPQVKAIFPQALIVAESGYQQQSQLAELQHVGFSAVLIGEGLSINPQLKPA